MASPYSLDLRQKILQAHERGMGSQREIAEFFAVSLSFVEKLLQRCMIPAMPLSKSKDVARARA